MTADHVFRDPSKESYLAFFRCCVRVMRNNIKHIILIFFFVLLTAGGHCYAMQNQHPPEPQKTANQEERLGPCGQGNGGGSSPNVPPPVGLCLPINDYLLPLLFTGIVLGAWKLNRIEKSV